MLAVRGQKLEIEGFIWMQGERDARDQDSAAAYERNLVDFVNHVRRDLGRPDLPFVMGQIQAPDYPYREVVKQAQAQVARLLRYVRLVPTSDLKLMDPVHYNSEGVMLLGRQFALEIRDVLRKSAVLPR